MREAAEEMIIRNLIEALARLNDDLDRVELWTAALYCFQRPVPEYQPSDEHLLPAKPRNRSRHAKF
ncbi:MAG TPA: hypothetical protein VGJ20_27540 [Xanthobacteraceae bacterium]|jgi:hypothetical protein